MQYVQRKVPVFGCQTIWFILTLFLTFGLGENSAVAAAPDNDNFSTATDNNGATGTISGSTVEATAEISEPNHMYPAHHSIWYKWTAPSADPIDFDTSGSSFDTVLAIYTGSTLDALTRRSTNDDDPYGINHSSRISFIPTSGVTYYIAVDGYDTASGSSVLHWGPPPSMQPYIIISGTVSLPNGIALGDRYISVNVSNEKGPRYYNATDVTVPHGASSASYSIDVPTITNAQWRISYYDCRNDKYVQNGYYNSRGTTWDISLATLIDGTNDHSNINLTLLTGNTISGTISLPSGYVAPSEGTLISINASSQNYQNNPGGCIGAFGMPKGTSSFTYTIAVAPDPNAQWRVRYSYLDIHWNTINTGYYNSTATTGNSAMATLLNGESSHNGINMRLLTTEGLTKLFPWNLFLPSIIKGNEKQ